MEDNNSFKVNFGIINGEKEFENTFDFLIFLISEYKEYSSLFKQVLSPFRKNVLIDKVYNALLEFKISNRSFPPEGFVAKLENLEFTSIDHKTILSLRNGDYSSYEIKPFMDAFKAMIVYFLYLSEIKIKEALGYDARKFQITDLPTGDNSDVEDILKSSVIFFNQIYKMDNLPFSGSPAFSAFHEMGKENRALLSKAFRFWIDADYKTSDSYDKLVADTLLPFKFVHQSILKKYFYENTKEIKEQAENAIAEINATRSQYDEFMQLKAPVEYWKGKKTEHKKEAKTKAIILFSYLIIAGIALLFAFYLLIHNLISVSQNNIPLVLYGIYATLALSLVTLYFWVGRILSRLYFAQYHLAIDAEERAVMVQTYLALTKDVEGLKEDRSLILAALLRPTEDGIVRDDNTDISGVASLLSKLLNKPS